MFKKESYKRFILIAFSLFISLIISEMTIRFFNLVPKREKIYWDSNRYVVEDIEFKFYSEHNSLGLREFREFFAKSAHKRIVFLGDSFVYGVGVSNHETFSYMTEQLLNEDSKYSWQVINSGIAGTGTFKQFECLKKILNTIEISGVVLFYFVDNDPYETYIEKNNLKRIYNLFDRSKAILNQYSELYLFLKLRFAKKGTFRAYPYTIFDQCNPEKILEFNEMDRITMDILEQIKKMLDSKNLDFSIVIIPRQEQISGKEFYKFKKNYGIENKNYDRFLPNRRVENILKSLNIDYINLLNKIDGKETQDLYYKLDGHFNKSGHRFLSELMQAWLRNRYDDIK